MTYATIVTGLKMTSRFTAGNNTVMTGGATSGYLAMIHRNRRLPLRCRMTGLAIIASGNVLRVFAAGVDAIVTDNTGVEDLAMINGRNRPPMFHVMTTTAEIGGAHMIHRFGRHRTAANPSRATVTTGALADDLIVIHRGRGNPYIHAMTRLAIVTGGQMTGRF